MFDEAPLLHQPPATAEDPNDPTRAPNYTPNYNSIFKPDQCVQCNTPPQPRHQAPNPSQPLNNTALSGNGDNLLLNQLLNNQPCQQNRQSTSLPNLQPQMPHPPLPHSSSPSMIPTHQGVHIGFVPLTESTMNYNMQQLQTSMQSNQTMYQQQQQPVQTPSHMPQQLAHHHQQQQQQQHQQQQFHHVRQPVRQQAQMAHYNNNQYNRTSPQMEDNSSYYDPSQTYTVIGHGGQPLYYAQPNQNLRPMAATVPRITYQPPQPLGTVRPNILRALHNRATRPRFLAPLVQQTNQTNQTFTPESLVNLQRAAVIRTPVSTPPPTRNLNAPNKNYSRARAVNPQQTVVPNFTPQSERSVLNPTAAIPITTSLSTSATQSALPISTQSSNQTLTSAPPPTSTPNLTPSTEIMPVTTISQNTPVSVSSTTRPSSAVHNQATEIGTNQVETANKACQVKSAAVTMVHKCLSACVETADAECQTGFEEKRPEIRTYVDRASSPIFIPNPLVRTKSTPKRRRIEVDPKGDDDEDEEIQVC